MAEPAEKVANRAAESCTFQLKNLGIERRLDNRIRAYRDARGLSLDRLASLMNTTNQQISNLETGKRRLTADWLQRLGKALGCHPWALVADDLPRPLLPQEIHLLNSFRNLGGAQRDAILQLVDSIAPGAFDAVENDLAVPTQ